MATWMDLEEVRDRWRDAPALDEYLQEVMDVSKAQVLEYGPKATADAIAANPEAVPDGYRLAHLIQARNIWNSAKADPASQGIGDDGFIIRPYPMDLTTQKMIRPMRAKPVVA
jgi:hypothetical protein